jgi:hypothetical protein
MPAQKTTMTKKKKKKKKKELEAAVNVRTYSKEGRWRCRRLWGLSRVGL